MQFRKILVRAPNWVGDAVMSLPALHALRDTYPGAHIAIIARPWVADLFRREPFCDELIPYGLAAGGRSLGAKLSFARGLRARRFDCAILFQNAFEAAAIVRAAGIPVRIGYDRDGRGLLLTHPIPTPRPGEIPRHERFYYVELLKRAGLIASCGLDLPIDLSASETAAARGREHFRELGIEAPVIGVSAGAAYGGAKRWLPERFAEAAIDIARQMHASVVLFGSQTEAAVCAEVQSLLEAGAVPALNLAGRTTLAEFIDLAAACDVYITNDSGPMHIASALGVPTIAVFGATDHEATGPTGSHTRVIREPVHCSPCLRRECPIDHRCMKAVESSRVTAAAFELLTIERETQPLNSFARNRG